MLEVPYGWLVRSVHVWGRQPVHRRGRAAFSQRALDPGLSPAARIDLVLGHGMLLLALAFGFSGYLLPWNELAFYATLVGTEIPAVVPGDRRASSCTFCGAASK